MTATLRDLREGVASDTISAGYFEAAAARLISAAAQIGKWACRRMEIIEEGFFRGIGTVAATGVIATGLWVLAGGKIQAVTELMKVFGGHLLGLP